MQLAGAAFVFFTQQNQLIVLHTQHYKSIGISQSLLTLQDTSAHRGGMLTKNKS